jgi:hypothetical protein
LVGFVWYTTAELIKTTVTFLDCFASGVVKKLKPTIYPKASPTLLKD